MLLSKQEIKQQQRLHFALLFWSPYSTADLIRKKTLGGKKMYESQAELKGDGKLDCVR